MALNDPYVTLEQYKAFEEIEADDTSKDVRLTQAILSATRAITNFCGRNFNRAETASERIFVPASPNTVIVDDFWETESHTVEIGTHNAWMLLTPETDYTLFPESRVMEGMDGWPVEAINLRGRLYQPIHDTRVRVSAKWGWEVVPEDVKQATLLLATRYYKLGDAPLGIVGLKRFSSTRAGDSGIGDLLCDYKKEPVLA